MKLIEIYCTLFFLSVLALQPVWSASKYLVPILPFLILIIGKAIMAKLDAGNVVRVAGNGGVSYITSTKRGEIRGIWLPIHHAVWRLVQPLMPTSRTSWRPRYPKKQLVWVLIPLIAFLLSNAIYTGVLAIKQIGNNIRYVQGDRYAGYPPEARKMFEAFERARDLPDSVVLICRKPEILYVVSGRQSVYPWEIKGEQ